MKIVMIKKFIYISLIWMVFHGASLHAATLLVEAESFSKSAEKLYISPPAVIKQINSFFSHQDPNMVEWFVKMVEERKNNHNSASEKKNW